MKWYTEKGEQGDVVLSTRVRLARNLKDYPFPVRLDRDRRCEIIDKVSKVLQENSDGTLKRLDMTNMPRVEKLSLAERHLISPEFASVSDGRAVLLSEDEDIGIMLCEEDHIRLQVIRPGLSLQQAYDTAAKIDDIIDEHLGYAFDERLGYLTQCPTNLGTGLRASLLLHLPALTGDNCIARLASTVAKLGLTLRGVYMDKTVPVGSVYQLSNRVTLGISEQAALKNLASIASQIISQERAARVAAVKNEQLIDKIYRAYGLLKNARLISFNEFLSLSSLVRLGASQGLTGLDGTKLNELFIRLQPATLNARNGGDLVSAQRDRIRADEIRQALD